MLQNSGYGNYSPNAFAPSLPALGMDSLPNGQSATSFGMADFPALQTGYSDPTSQVSPPLSLESANAASQQPSSQQHGRYHANSTGSNFSYNGHSLDGSAFLSNGNANSQKDELATTNFLSRDVANFFGAGGDEPVTQSPLQSQDPYGQQQSNRPSMQHYDSTGSFGSQHQATPQSEGLHTPSSQQQPLPPTSLDSQGAGRSGYSPLSNPNGGSLTSTKSFSSALDWNNTKPSGGLAAPAGPPKALPQRQVSFPAMLNARQRQQFKQVQQTQAQQQQRGQQHQQAPTQQSMQFQQPQQGTSKSSSRPLVSNTGVMRIEDVYKHVNKPHVGD